MLMLYMLMIGYDRTQPVNPEQTNLQPRHAELEAELRERGLYAGGAALMSVEGVPAVRVKNGSATTDGPFAETKEVLGGYYVVECKDQDEAIEFAKRIPVEDRAWVDVRPVLLWHPK
jgi:hypothetical protein